MAIPQTTPLTYFDEVERNFQHFRHISDLDNEAGGWRTRAASDAQLRLLAHDYTDVMQAFRTHGDEHGFINLASGDVPADILEAVIRINSANPNDILGTMNAINRSQTGPGWPYVDMETISNMAADKASPNSLLYSGFLIGASVAALSVPYFAPKIAAALGQSAPAAREKIREWIGGVAQQNLKPTRLMNELAQSGVKYTANDVVMVARMANDKLVWLEKGDGRRGLIHILDHIGDLAAKGVTGDIPRILQRVLQSPPVRTGMSKAGPYADYLINGNLFRVAFGSNGFIVSFYPIPG